MCDIKLFAIDKVVHLVQPDEFHEFDLSSPALEFFTDFKRHMPLTIEGSSPAVDVEMLMRKAHVKLKLVVDSSNEFIGTISLDDLSEPEFMIRVAQGFKLHDITVSDLMCPKRRILALDVEQLEQATIGDIVKALKQSGQQHCLVVDRVNDHIRGLVSASDVARRLHIPINIERIPTFVDIFSSVRRPAR